MSIVVHTLTGHTAVTITGIDFMETGHRFQILNKGKTIQGICECGFETKAYRPNKRYPNVAMKYAVEAITKHYRQARIAALLTRYKPEP